MHEGLHYINEENISTHSYDLKTLRLTGVLDELRLEFSDSFINQPLLTSALAKSRHRVLKRRELWKDTVGPASHLQSSSADAIYVSGICYPGSRFKAHYTCE